MRAERCHFCQQRRTACPTPQACVLAEDIAWLKFHKRMCRVTAIALVAAMVATLAVVMGW